MKRILPAILLACCLLCILASAQAVWDEWKNEEWYCPNCDRLNEAYRNTCAACGTERQEPPRSAMRNASWSGVAARKTDGVWMIEATVTVGPVYGEAIVDSETGLYVLPHTMALIYREDKQLGAYAVKAYETPEGSYMFAAEIGFRLAPNLPEGTYVVRFYQYSDHWHGGPVYQYTDIAVSLQEGSGVPINSVNFPDAAFRDFVWQYDTDHNALLGEAELAAVTEMDVHNKGIESLQGIEFFTSLRMLDCVGNNLVSLDLGKNTALTKLSCDYNRLQALDVSRNTALAELWCSYNQLAELNLSGNPALVEVVCNDNQLTGLYVSGCPSLAGLDCYNNQLASLDVSQNPALNWLECQGNRIDTLDIRKCPILVELAKDEPFAKDGTFSWRGSADSGEVISILYIDDSVTLLAATPAEQLAKIRAFVTRCYRIILSREPDEGGLNTWVSELDSGRKAASEIIDRFVNSPEYQGKHYSSEESVEILYQAMMGRKSDPAGKQNWVSKLQAGKPFAVVINGFCVSKEFKEICNSYGIRPGSVTVPDDNPVTPDEKIKAFVRRCYQIILSREPDEGGLNTWFNELKSGRKAASEIIDRFVNSPEFTGKYYSYEDSVEILYRTMLGRGSDPAGKQNWVAKLRNGQPFAVVINGFCISPEFKGICASYGIRPGFVAVASSEPEPLAEVIGEAAAAGEKEKKEPSGSSARQIVLPSEEENDQLGAAVRVVYYNEAKAADFIRRCYRSVLGREPGQAELDTWTAQLMNGQKTPDQIARGFLFSQEFKNRNVGSGDLVKILYRVYLNREADPEGLAAWTAKLDGGTDLKDLLDAFAKTGEFKTVLKDLTD